MDITNFKKLRRIYGALPSLRIYICQEAQVDCFCADSHLGQLIEENDIGKIERWTSKRLYETAQSIVETIQEQQKNMLSMAEARHKRFIYQVFSKS